MGIRANWVAVRDGVSLPCVEHTEYHEWFRHYATNFEHGIRNGRIPKYFLLNEMVVETKQIVVHSFNMGDVDDPDLYAAEPLWEWQNSEAGKWCMERALEVPMWNRVADPMYYGHKYIITATFDAKTLTEFYLRFGKVSP